MAALLIFCVFAWFYGEVSADKSFTLASSVDIIAKGRLCVEVAENAIQATMQNDIDTAMAHLQSLKEDGRYLSKHANSRINFLENREGELHKKLEGVQKKIADSSKKEIDFKEQLKITKITLQNEQRNRDDNIRQVQEAKNSLQHAERRLRDAKDDARDNRRNGALIGAVIGLFGGPVGAIAGGALGAAGGELINEIEGDVRDAKDRVWSKEHALNEAETAVQRTQQLIANKETQLEELSINIKSKQGEQNSLYKEAEKVRNAIVFQMEAAELWGMFLQATEGATDWTKYLHKIVVRANDIQDWNILRSDGTKLAEASFLEAWEAVETTAKETGSHYEMFAIE